MENFVLNLAAQGRAGGRVDVARVLDDVEDTGDGRFERLARGRLGLRGLGRGEAEAEGKEDGAKETDSV